MSKIPNGHEIISLFESMYPKHLAMEGDKIGLQIGALNKPVRHVLIALDVTEEVVDEAIQLGGKCHYCSSSFNFNPLKAIHTDKAYGKIIEKVY
ncbi:Nif3-like dinuclear metal center hexameric protein [Bacillus cereus]